MGMTKERRSLVEKAFNAWICDEGGFFRLTKKEERPLGMTTNQLRKKFIKRYPPDSPCLANSATLLHVVKERLRRARNEKALCG
jgi:hypothetical protein